MLRDHTRALYSEPTDAVRDVPWPRPDTGRQPHVGRPANSLEFALPLPVNGRSFEVPCTEDGDRPIQRPLMAKSFPIAVGGSVAHMPGTALMIAATNVFEFGPGQAR